MEALPDPSCLSPSANSCQLRVNTLHKSHNWRLIIAETSGSSFLPALFLKMSCVIIPSITVGLLLSLKHMPLQTATKDVLSGQAARPPRHFPSQAVRSSSSLPEPWHLPLNKSFSFVWRRPLSLLFTLFWLSKQFWRKLIQLSGVQFWCHSSLSKCHRNLPSFAPSYLVLSWFLPGKSCLPLCPELTIFHLPYFLMFFPLCSFPSLLSVIFINRFCMSQCWLHSPKECAFSSSKRRKGMPAWEPDRSLLWCYVLQYLPCLTQR